MKNTVEEVFQCPECGLKYREKEWADKCKAWCKEHGTSCDPEVVKHAMVED